MASTQRATTSGSAIRQAPNRPLRTLSLGQPTLRLISSNPRSAASPGAPAELARIAAAELKRDRVLLLREVEQPVAPTVHERRARHHLGIEQGMAGDEPDQIPEVPVRAVHHRRDAEPAVNRRRACTRTRPCAIHVMRTLPHGSVPRPFQHAPRSRDERPSVPPRSCPVTAVRTSASTRVTVEVPATSCPRKRKNPLISCGIVTREFARQSRLSPAVVGARAAISSESGSSAA